MLRNYVIYRMLKLSAISSHIYTPYAKHELVIFYAVKKKEEQSVTYICDMKKWVENMFLHF